MALLITRADVPVLSMADAVETIEAMYANSPEDRVVHAPVRVPLPTGSLRLVSGALLREGVAGVRVGTASGLAGDTSVVVLFEVASGNLVAIVAASTGVLRTGATAAVATKWAARSDSSVAALIGVGRNAWSILEGLALARPLTAVRVFSRDPRRRERFAAAATQRLGLDVRAAASSAEAVHDADVVTCMTDSTGPVVDADDLAPDAHVNSLGAVCELPADLYLSAAAIYVGSKRQEKHYQHYHRFDGHAPPHHLLDLAATGALDWDSAVHDLSDARPTARKTPSTGRSIFKDSRGGVGDLALAYEIYRRVRDDGRGLELDLRTSP